MQSVLLQKPHAKSKTKDHIACLERRLSFWNEGKFKELLSEGKCIQRHLSNLTASNLTTHDEMQKIARGFNRLMLQGKVRQAVNLISNANRRGLLNTDTLIPVGEDKDGNIQWKTTNEILMEKHPPECIPSDDILLQNRNCDKSHYDPIIFERITGNLIREAATKIQGSAGPSGVDAYLWRRFCLSFKTASTELCNALAGVARRLCTSAVAPESLSAFVACRLISLDKNPGIRPIGIGEVPRRIIAKSVLRVVPEDIQEAAGPLQTCAGYEAGCEAAVHALNQMMESEETEALLLVDATNAFNTLNRQAALHNIQVICPVISTILNNTYKAPVRMFVAGGGEIASREGTTQGDPLAMAMYALAITPLIKRLKEQVPTASQVWFADDSSAAGRLVALRNWWQHLMILGPEFGYFPNAGKTTVVVKEEFLKQKQRSYLMKPASRLPLMVIKCSVLLVVNVPLWTDM